MATNELPTDIAEHLAYAHANGCAGAFQQVAGADELQPALVKIIGPQPVCVSFTTFAGQGNAVVDDEDWQWLVENGGLPGGAKAAGTLSPGEPEARKIEVKLAPRADAAERTLTVGSVVLRLPAGEWDHLLANQAAYAD